MLEEGREVAPGAKRGYRQVKGGEVIAFLCVKAHNHLIDLAIEWSNVLTCVPEGFGRIDRVRHGKRSVPDKVRE